MKNDAKNDPPLRPLRLHRAYHGGILAHEQLEVTNMISLVARYARYSFSALSTVAFSLVFN
jgi:hypothetical protein